MLPALGWALAVFAALTAAALYRQLRATGGRLRARDAEVRALTEARDDLAKRLEQRSEAHRKRGEELADVRKRLEKARRRRGDARAQAQAEPEKLARVESQLAQVRADLAGAREERDAAHAALAQAQARHARELSAASAAPAPPPDPAPERAEAAARLERVEGELEELRTALAEAKRQAARQRKRADNLDKVYMVLRGEHELGKDRLRQLEAELIRLQALRVTLAGRVGEEAGEEAVPAEVEPGSAPPEPTDGIRPVPPGAAAASETAKPAPSVPAPTAPTGDD